MPLKNVGRQVGRSTIARILKVHWLPPTLQRPTSCDRVSHIIWGFQHVVGFRRRHVGASIQEAWTTSLDSVRAALDADPAHDRLVLLRATSQELGPTRDAVVDTAVQRLELSQKQAAEACTLAETFETSPRSVCCKGSRV